MNIKELSASFSVSAQLSPDDVATAAQRGFRKIINNRPDDEEPDQPASAELAKAAAANGLEYSAIPVAGSESLVANVDAMRRQLAGCDGPVLAFCRSGTRSAMLWAYVEAQHRDVADVLLATSNAGYDLSAHQRQLLAQRRDR